MRVAGVLMPIASLPSPYGIGDFGKEAFEFVDRMASVGVKLWQILPIHPLGYGNSPYQPFSSYAGETLYLSLQLMWEEGLLTKEEIKAVEEKVGSVGNPERIAYETVRKEKEVLYRKAFTRFIKTEDYEHFIENSWVYSYGVFVSLKKKNNGACWNTWPREERKWVKSMAYDENELIDEIQYQMFLQYLFFKQWKALKSYANEKGISIMGDMPFYVGLDSQDVWENQECFLLDEEARPTHVAGVPPDYFSASGQRWGNPIYNWEHMKKTEFSFWINRMATSSQIFDVIRLDHFRAFDTYWKIPSDCDTAMVGEWVEAPGYEFFDTLYGKLKDIKIVVEDLGLLRPEVGKLRDYFNFPGMRVLQFTFLEDLTTLKHYEKKNIITYTGTHDNDTILGWYNSQSKENQNLIRKKLKALGVYRKSIPWSFVTLCFQTGADTAIVPYQDLIEKGSLSRINTPGTVGSPNWEWRCTSFKDWDRVASRLKALIEKTNR